LVVFDDATKSAAASTAWAGNSSSPFSIDIIDRVAKHLGVKLAGRRPA
jgi:hypothetical protein